nr:cell wall-binding repeat-containing protein [uncultured Romboutsia sp.]
MLKKKNIAMVMAAATVATSVAPVFAATIEKTEVDEATLVAKVQELLNTKYSDAKEDGDGNDDTLATEPGMSYTNSVYSIDANGTTVKSIAQFKTIVENAKVLNEEVIVTVTDKGHRTVDGKIVATENTKYSFYSDFKDTGQFDETKIDRLGGSVKDLVTTSATIVLANNTEIELASADYVLNLDEPVDANGNLVDITNLTTSVKKSIVGFNKAEDKEASEKEIPSRIIEQLSFNGAKFVEMEKKASDIFADDEYTKEGAEFVKTIIDAKSSINVVKDGVRYTLTNAKTTDVVVNQSSGYKFDITLTATKVVNGKNVVSNVKITLTGDVQKDLATIKGAIDNDTTVTDLTGKIDKLAGDDRFETAAKISKATYVKSGDARAIILVGEEAIVDGLAAAPLAKQEDAPILLTKKDEIPAATMNEIKRATENEGKEAKIYLVGGENNISKEVEKQLTSELNAEIVRIAGEDRFKTSIKIAKKLNSTNKAFVVGGDGLADAMSIASVATKEEAPIIVTPADGLTKDAKDFINKDDEVIVVGGQSKVSTQVLKDIKEETEQTTAVERIAGEDRNETNAMVIEKYANASTKVYVAKNGYGSANGDAQLVDALAVAPLVANNDGIVVLANDELTKVQEKAIKTKQIKGKLTQVGGGVGVNVIQKLVDLLK